MILKTTGDYIVVEYALGNERIAGKIPTELGRLKNWKYVVFSKCIALYALSTDIHYLSLMNMIFNHLCSSLDNNSIHGTVPTEFGMLESAETLWLSKLKVCSSLWLIELKSWLSYPLSFNLLLIF